MNDLLAFKQLTLALTSCGRVSALSILSIVGFKQYISIAGDALFIIILDLFN